jgi:hypothetical protein
MSPEDPRPTALVGDIHGCARELEELLRRVGDRHVVSLGDVLDRGPDSEGAVRLLRERDADVLLGNHEEKHLRWRRHQRKARTSPSHDNPMKLAPHHHAVQASLSAESWQWLEERSQPFLRLDEHGVLAVHAGLLAGVAPERHKPDRICRVQLTRPGSERSPWGSFSPDAEGRPKPDFDEAEGFRFWTEHLHEGPVVVYGHSVFPTPLATHRVGETVTHSFVRDARPAREGLRALGIDTGVPFGGSLTALLLPEWTFVSVKAEKRYFAGRLSDD